MNSVYGEPPFVTDYRTADVSAGTSGKRSHARDGNALVVLYRGIASSSDDELRTSNSLGLRKTNSQRVVRLDNPVVYGQVEKLQQRLYVYLLGLPSNIERAKGTKEEVPLKQFDVVHQEYSYGDDIDGVFVRFPNGEYFQFERQVGSVAIAWSSALPLNSIWERVSPILDFPPANEEGVAKFTDGPHVHDKAISILNQTMHDPDAVRFLRLEYPRYALVWRAPRPKAVEFSVALAECGIIGYSFDDINNVKLIQETATPDVASVAHQLIQLALERSG
jgi:ribosomal protein L30/L7E